MTTTYTNEPTGRDLEQAQICVGVEPIDEFPTIVLIIRSPMIIQIKINNTSSMDIFVLIP